MGWFSGKGIDLHPRVQRSIFTNDMGCGQKWDVDQIYYINSLVCACVCDHWTHRLRDGKKKSDGGHKEK